MAEPILLTRKGYEQKQARLDYLLHERRQQIAEYLHEAQASSELNDVSLYEDARQLQAQLDAEIAELQRLLERAVIVDPEEDRRREEQQGTRERTVRLGTTVVLQTPHGQRTVMVVSSAEADALQQKISDLSPLGSALLGHKAGETVDVQTPRGPVPYTITSVE